MPEAYNCPHCGAAIDIHAGHTDPVIRCSFCNNTSVVPEQFLTKQQAPPQIFIQSSSPTPVAMQSSGRSGCAISMVAVVLLLVIGGVAAGVFLFLMPLGRLANDASPFDGDVPFSEDSDGFILPTPEAIAEEAGFASVTLQFGGEGTGPGFFEDARTVAVDGEGFIYVGDRTDPARIQRFEADGTFITQWTLDNETPLTDLTVDRQGVVYAVYQGDIHRFDGATGEALGIINYAEGWGFDSVYPTADGGLVAGWYKNRDDVVVFDANGQATLTIREAISSVTGDPELTTYVAMDGLGTIYALGSFNEAVFVFNPDGSYSNRFGGEGDEPGQFTAVLDIAIDGQGRIYVSDFKGILVFDSDGRYLDMIDVDGPSFGLFFDDANNLYVAARTRIYKYVLNE